MTKRRRKPRPRSPTPEHRRGDGGLIVRRLIVVVVALLLAVQVVRSAAVTALATVHPETAAKFWARHPSVEISLGLARIGRAARERKTIDQNVFAMIDDAAVKSPLSPEPFLVRGVQAQTAGDAEAARLAFLAAQSRDPRSLPAAYFLADYYFRAGDALPGLQQTVLLARLSPGGPTAVAPFVAPTRRIARTGARCAPCSDRNRQSKTRFYRSSRKSPAMPTLCSPSPTQVTVRLTVPGFRFFCVAS